VDGPLPHPTLRHEIVHAVAAAAARGPFRVPARALVVVSTGLVEGVAAALETPQSRWTLHEWSRAARDLGFLPDVRRIVGPAGFWSQPPARAYTAAGSFLAFVLERRGAAVVREAYRTGDLAGAAGAPLDALVSEWERFLDGVEPAPGLVTAARARLSRGSLFTRTCAREVALLEARAGAAGAAGRTSEACGLWREAAARSGSAADLAAAGHVLARSGDLEGAEAAYREAERAARPEDAALRASLGAARGDLAWRRGEVAAAVSAWATALAIGPERADARLLHAKVLAASDRDLGPAARDLLLGLGDPTLALARVARVDHPLSAYLVGRALAGRGDAAAAAVELARAAEGGLPGPLADEASLLLGGARCRAGETDRGAEGLRERLARASTTADRARLEEAIRRCAFEAARAGR
jgi:tetratricopeptide (TPR) repeat protein